MSTALVWFRRDLRVHDHPPLARAVAAHDRVVPVFVLDRTLLAGGRFPSPSRTEFLLGCLAALDAALGERGAGLVLREGPAAAALVAVAIETRAEAVYWAGDVSPYARVRDRGVTAALREAGVAALPQPGNFVADVDAVRTQDGRPFVVFSPFHRAWLDAPRRPVEPAPARVELPGGLDRGTLPALGDLGLEAELTGDDAERFVPGEAAGRERMAAWVRDGVDGYDRRHDALSGGSSMLSPYLHFGCVSARELEAGVIGRPRPAGKARAAFRRQLGWRDFYAAVLLHFPANARLEFQDRYRDLAWEPDRDRLEAWRAGRTGYPLVDAGMRQLRAIGWMHNRARLVAGSFLTKDLHQDWRAGEAHFMRLLLDGDEANNNGNWQWIASVGVDPQPYFRRIYNPARHQERFDPDGSYVRRWVPELRGVPDERLAEPWRMSVEEQAAAGCVIGRDYPAPVVDHKAERLRAMERFRAATAAPSPGGRRA